MIYVEHGPGLEVDLHAGTCSESLIPKLKGRNVVGIYLPWSLYPCPIPTIVAGPKP